VAGGASGRTNPRPGLRPVTPLPTGYSPPQQPPPQVYLPEQPPEVLQDEQPEPAHTDQLPPQQPPKSKLPAILGVVLLVAVGAAAVFFLVGRGGSSARPAEEKAVQAPPPSPPPELAPLTFGMAAPFSGPAKELGRQMRIGIELAFNAANESGGVNGRKLKLLPLDDGYEPERTAAVMHKLIDEHHVAGFIGNVGTPTAVVAVPIALEKKMLFFGAFTGALLLRKEPPDRYVFNYRASYPEETAATVRYLVELRRVKPEQIAVFAQQDSYGDAGFEGVARTLRLQYKRDPASILRVGYPRNTIDVNGAVDGILAAKNVRAIVTVGAYRAISKFVERLREKGGDQIITSVSFVGSTALAEELIQMGPRMAQGVIVTQVVPLPESGSTAVLKYRDLLGRLAPGEKPDFVSLEGYVAGNLLLEGLRKAPKEFTTEQLIDVLEQLRGVDLGFGVPFNFSLSEHQASHKVWGTVLDDKGHYQSIDLE
jgi:ABC-type branched-subunit amino acid transport system substrate-binding protein